MVQQRLHLLFPSSTFVRPVDLADVVGNGFTHLGVNIISWRRFGLRFFLGLIGLGLLGLRSRGGFLLDRFQRVGAQRGQGIGGRGKGLDCRGQFCEMFFDGHRVSVPSWRLIRTFSVCHPSKPQPESICKFSVLSCK